MCKFKKGDKVVIVKSQNGNPEVLRNGVTGIVLDLQVAPFVQFNIDANDCLHDACGIGEEGKCYSMDEDELELYSEYKQSNRYKLSQAIKSTGFHAEKLSLETGHAKTYFTGFTAESRFNSRGDITEERLNSLLTTLAFAERKLLDLAPKTVDENNVPVGEEKSTMIVDGVKIEGTISEFNIEFDNNSSTEMYKKYFYEAEKRNQSKRNAKAKKFLIVFVLVVIILAVYFFTR